MKKLNRKKPHKSKEYERWVFYYHTAVLTSSSAYEPALMVRAEGLVGLHLTTDAEGWRRVWPFTHSDLSRTSEDLSRDGDAEAIDEHYHNLISYRTTFVLASLPHMQRFRFIYSSQVMSRLRLLWANLSSLDMWTITWASLPFWAAISWFKWMLFFSPRKNELEKRLILFCHCVTSSDKCITCTKKGTNYCCL